MRVDIFCAWGDGPDVGINVHLTEQEQRDWSLGLIPIDLTADEAIEMAHKLLSAAEGAKELDRSYEEHVRWQMETGSSGLIGSPPVSGSTP